MDNICSLKQDPRAKMALNCTLVVLVTLAVLLYVMFSSGNMFGLVHMHDRLPDNVTVAANSSNIYSST